MAASAGARARGQGETGGASARARGWLPHLAALGGYVALTVGLFWQLAFLPNVQMPKGGGDLASYLFPLYSFAAESIHSGVFPLWLPSLFGGAPFAADMQSGIFYPPNLVAFLAAPTFTYATLETLAVVHYVIAATLAYAYGRVLGLGGPAAFAAGIAFGFSGFLVSHFGHYNMLASAAWLPGSAAALTLALRRGGLRFAALASALFALTLLAGHTQIALFGGLYLGTVWLWECLQSALVSDDARPRRAPRRFEARRLLGWRFAVLPGVLLLAALASAVLLLPAAELTRYSIRSEISYAQAIEYSASPLGLITLIVPHFFGDNPGAFWGVKWGLHEVYGYVGAAALVFAVLGLVTHRRNPIVWFLALAALGGLLLSFADYTVLHGWLYRFVPGFDKVRAAGRFLLLVDLALAGLVGFGVQSLFDGARRADRPHARALARATLALLGIALVVAVPLGYRTLINSQDRDPAIYTRVEMAITSVNYTLLFVGLAALALVAHVRRFRPRLVAALAIALVALDLLSANARLNPTTPDALAGFRHPKVVEFLKSEPGNYRIDTVTGIYDVWQPDLAALAGLDDVGGLFSPMKLADFHNYWEGIGSRSTAAYDLLSAKYAVTTKDVQLDWSKYQPVLTDAPGVNVHANAKALPRAFVVPAAQVTPRDAILAKLREPSFDPRGVVLVEPDAEPALGAIGTVAKPSVVVAVDYRSPNEVVVRLDGGAGGYLFLSEVYYPGWVARIDGAGAPILRGNYLFRVVPLPAGAREARVSFEPPLLRVGLALTALGWLAIAGMLAADRVRWPAPKETAGASR